MRSPFPDMELYVCLLMSVCVLLLFFLSASAGAPVGVRTVMPDARGGAFPAGGTVAPVAKLSVRPLPADGALTNTLSALPWTLGAVALIVLLLWYLSRKKRG